QFRIPPAELREMLPQQTLALLSAAAALADAGRSDESEELRLRTGVFLGINLDPNTTNFCLRWSLGELAERDACTPPLSADRTMGALGSIAASRVARAFHFGGPSFTISSEESSGAQALAAAVRALRRGEVARALVGAVDLAGDPRALATASATVPGEGAACVALQRLAEARRRRAPGGAGVRARGA